MPSGKVVELCSTPRQGPRRLRLGFAKSWTAQCVWLYRTQLTRVKVSSTFSKVVGVWGQSPQPPEGERLPVADTPRTDRAGRRDPITIVQKIFQ